MVVNFDSTSLKMMTKMIFLMRMMMIMMTLMMMIIEIKMVITWPIFKLNAPNFAWQFIQLIPID